MNLRYTTCGKSHSNSQQILGEAVLEARTNKQPEREAQATAKLNERYKECSDTYSELHANCTRRYEALLASEQQSHS